MFLLHNKMKKIYLSFHMFSISVLLNLSFQVRPCSQQEHSQVFQYDACLMHMFSMDPTIHSKTVRPAIPVLKVFLDEQR